MVVVDNARRMIGKTIATQVTSVLQTTAGKMIFGRFPEESDSGGAGQTYRTDRRSGEKLAQGERNSMEDEGERVRDR